MKRIWLGLALTIVLVLTVSSRFVSLTDHKTRPTTPTHISPPVEKLSLCAVGDVMLARKVDRLMKAQGDDYPFRMTKGELSASDICFANLETSISDRGYPLPGKGINFRARPAMAAILKETGFDVLSVANNHSLDYDTPAFMDTLNLLKAQDIRTVGGGSNIVEARKPVVFDKNGLKIGFLAYTIFANIIYDSSYPCAFQATQTRSGVAPLVKDLILEDVAALDPKVNYTVVSLHWGTEYSPRPDAEQKALAQNLIDAGVDVIIGHHPHIIQGFERYKQGLIAYSLGNFVFDQNQHVFTRQGLILKLNFTRSGLSDIYALPVFINQSQPVVLKGQEAKQILLDVQNRSRELGTETSIAGNRLNILNGGV